ncbi:MAG: glycerophosphoryl diester phosphodiesterase [Planctomycetota bacterium]|jgi:glycerophosphoryl diester phosphodiesterase
MIEFKLTAPSYEMIAHRGYPSRFPENTLSGIRAVLEGGAKFLKVEVQLSASGTAWLFHDESLERICSKEGKLVELNDSEVCGLRAVEAARLGTQFVDEPLADLKSVVELLSEFPSVFTFIEIRACAVEAFGATQVVGTVVKEVASIAQRCGILSSSMDCLRAVDAATEIPFGLILESWGQVGTEAKELPCSYIFCEFTLLPWSGSIEVDCQLGVFEVSDGPNARKLGARGASFVETASYPEMKIELAKSPGAMTR